MKATRPKIHTMVALLLTFIVIVALWHQAILQLEPMPEIWSAVILHIAMLTIVGTIMLLASFFVMVIIGFLVDEI